MHPLMHHMMRTLLSFLNVPRVTLAEACKIAALPPRRATVWLQRSDPENMPVPTGVLMGERKRLFTGLEVLQLQVLTRLTEIGHTAGHAAIWAESATAQMAHLRLLAQPISSTLMLELPDVGLFIRSNEGIEVPQKKVRDTGAFVEIASIRATLKATITLLDEGRAERTYTQVPIGALLSWTIVHLAEPGSPEATAIAETRQRLAAGE